MTEPEFLDRKLGEIADNTLKDNSANIKAINSQATKAGAMGGSRHKLEIEESFKSHFQQCVIAMAKFALQHCEENGHPKEIARDALKKAANNLQTSLLADFEARLFASAAFDGGRGPTAQQKIASKLKSEIEGVLNSALLDMERGYAGTEQIFKEEVSAPTISRIELDETDGAFGKTIIVFFQKLDWKYWLVIVVAVLGVIGTFLGLS